MKVLICGSGAMGTLFGTTLIKGGNEVLFLDAWPTLIETMKSRSTAVRITSAGEEEVPVTVKSFNEAPNDEYDVLFITVKSSATRETLQTIQARGLISPKTVVITLQGGFDNPDIIAEFIPDTKLLIYGRTCSACTSAGIMKITNFVLEKTTVWPLGTKSDESPASRVVEVVEILNRSGLGFELTNLAIPDRWRMLLYYPTNIAVSAIVKVNFGKTWACPAARHVLVELAKECGKIAGLEGVDPKYFNEQIAVESVEKIAVSECPEHSGSMIADITNKRITENEATAGALLKLAAKHGVDLPYTSTIYGLIKCIETNYSS